MVGDGGTGGDKVSWQDNHPRLQRSPDGGCESLEHRPARRQCSQEEERGPEAILAAGDSPMMVHIILEK